MLTREIKPDTIYRVNAPRALMDGELVKVYCVEDFRDGGYFICDDRAWFLESECFDEVTEKEIEDEYEKD